MNAPPVFDIDIELRRGGFSRRVRIEDAHRAIAIAGPSGAGKTSVLHAISGLIAPTRGHLRIDGQTLYDAARGIEVPAHRRRIGYVFQDLRLFPHLDVRGNLLYGLRGDARRAPKFELDAVVELLGIRALLPRRTPHLSGGEAQRVAIGRALLAQPTVLLLDEPLSSLDQPRREELIPYLQRVRDDTGLPIVYVSHSASEVARLTHAAHVLE